MRIGVKRRFRDRQESCFLKRRIVSSTVAGAVGLPDKFDKQGGDCESQMANDDTLLTQSAMESEILSLSTNSEKVGKEAASAKEE